MTNVVPGQALLAADAVVSEILQERLRQIEVEGWSAEHDDAHVHSELATAAACYALHTANPSALIGAIRGLWPWKLSWWKPKSPRRDLVRAAALLVAEIQRLDRIGTEDRVPI